MAQEQATHAVVRQIIGAGRGRGGHIRDSFALLERIVAEIVSLSGEEADDAAMLDDLMGGVKERLATLRHPPA